MLLARIKKITLFLIFFLYIFISPIFAQSEFSTAYSIIYDIQEDGTTRVNQQIALENLTQEYYASEYTLSISTLGIEEVSASDNEGPIKPDVSRIDKETNIHLKFNDQVVGLGNKLRFSLSYISKDTTIKLGRIWEINIPKLSPSPEIISYNVTLRVPKEFGSEMFIYPEPLRREEADNKFIYYFDKTNIQSSGVTASFGDFQLYSFTLTYHLKNPTSGPILTEIALPPDITNVQQIVYKYLYPEPKQIRLDEDGNYLAEYQLKGHEKLDIFLSGLAKVLFKERNLKNSLSASDIPEELLTLYTKPQKFWETYDPDIIKKAQELVDREKSVADNARQIYDFVTKELTYSSERVTKNLIRYGASQAFKRKDEAVCMEFTDLYIALARAAGIPAREIDGYAYTFDTERRPTIGDVLHTWVEIYIPTIGWIQIDPTWGATTKGLDYFSKLDTNHFVFVIKGLDSEWPYPAGAYKLSPDQVGDIVVNFATDAEFKNLETLGMSSLDIKTTLPKVHISPFPLKGKLTVKNTGAVTLFNGAVNILANDLTFSDSTLLRIGTLPPKTTKEIAFSSRKLPWFFKGKSIVTFKTEFSSFTQEKIIKDETKEVLFKPFYAYFFNKFVLIFLLMLALCMTFLLLLYLRLFRKP